MSSMVASPASTAALTPAASVRTPTPVNASSPQSVKSPKPKPKATPTAKKPPRKPSVRAGANVPQPPAPASTLAPAASTSTPASPPDSAGKRQREEDAAPVPAQIGAQGPPKRVKSEWDGPASDDTISRRQTHEAGIKTVEDALAYLEHTSAALSEQIAAEGSNSQLRADTEASLAQIRGVSASASDSIDDFTSLLGGALKHEPGASGGNATDSTDGFEFFDFTSLGKYEEDDKAAVAPLPDLLPSTSTKSSPQSDSTFGGTPKLAALAKAVADPAIVPPSGDDPYRLGIWSELDGGESAYFQPSDGWKWSGDMPLADWAILHP
jgi:hypothetical protein